MNVESALRTWLIAKGMLSARVKAACGEDFALRLIDQWTGLLTSSHKLGLRSDDTAGLFRDIEMVRGGQVLIFGQTVMPDSTLIVHPWLAELGDTPLDETLIGLSGVDRGAYEYAWLPVDDPLTARALRDRGSPAGWFVGAPLAGCPARGTASDARGISSRHGPKSGARLSICRRTGF